jgi:aquaglyceroporin related protein
MADSKAVHSYPSPAISHEEDIHEDKMEIEEHHLEAYAEHGPGIDHKIPQDNVVQARPELAWSKIRRAMRDPFAEFFGVFILILFGDGYVSTSNTHESSLTVF